MKKLEQNFGELVKKKQVTNIPGTPRLTQTATKNEEEKLGKKVHRIFGSGVRSLLHLLKHSRAELSNPIRELSGCMAGPTKENVEEMHRVIKWALDGPNVGLRMNPKVTFNDKGEVMWRLDGTCNSTWGSNGEDRKSVTGHILCFIGVLVAWKLKSQQNVSLSSSEAECVAISELVKEALFVLQILEDMHIKV